MTIMAQPMQERLADAPPPLLLPDLVIKGFRGIDSLAIPQLGRVTLIAGENGIGKTTVLEAVRVYAAGGRYSALAKVLNDREEISFANDEADSEEAGRPYGPDLSALFYGRDLGRDPHFTVGPNSETERMVVRSIPINEASADVQDRVYRIFGEEGAPIVQVHFRGLTTSIPWMSPSDFSASGVRRRTMQGSSLSQDDSPYPAVICQSFGPDRPTSRDTSRLWTDVALTPDEDVAARAVGMVIGKAVNRISVLTMQGLRLAKPTAIVRLEDSVHPVPLKSLGDGAARLFGLVLAIANSKNGFLLIDEAENGLHYTRQADVWRIVLSQAMVHNVQVIATTHSADCIRGFAEVVNENPGLDGVYFRIERDAEGLYTVNYPKRNLLSATLNRTETR